MEVLYDTTLVEDVVFREIKMREEQELSAWEREMMGVKSRLNDITVNLFEKVD